MSCLRFAIYIHEHQGRRLTYRAPLAGDTTPPETITKNGRTYHLQMISTVERVSTPEPTTVSQQ